MFFNESHNPGINVKIQSSDGASVTRLRNVKVKLQAVRLKNIKDSEYKICCYNKTGEEKYSFYLTNNVEKISSKFASRGLVTLTLKDPVVHVMFSLIHTTSDNLSWIRRFIGSITAHLTGKVLKSDKIHLSLKPVCDIPKDLLYLKKFLTPQIMEGSISILDLTGAGIRDLPISFGDLKLTHLNLTGNELGHGSYLWPWVNGVIKNTLTHIHLDKNKLIKIPNELGRCTRLVFLSMNENLFDQLPPNLTDPKKPLRTLSVASNPNLRFLFLKPHQLISLNVADCPNLTDSSERLRVRNIGALSLSEIAGMKVLKLRLNLERKDVPEEVLDILDSYYWCLFCRRRVINQELRAIIVNSKSIRNYAQEIVTHGQEICLGEAYCNECVKSTFRIFQNLKNDLM